MAVTIDIVPDAEKTQIKLAGEVDVSNADELRQALAGVFAQDTKALEIDMTNVPYIDSTGIGVLVGAAHRAADAKAVLHVTNPQRNVSRVFRMLGVESELGLTD